MPDPHRIGTVERALQLAKEGRYSLVEIRQVLRAEGYDAIDNHLSGLAIRRQLLRLIDEARR